MKMKSIVKLTKAIVVLMALFLNFNTIFAQEVTILGPDKIYLNTSSVGSYTLSNLQNNQIVRTSWDVYYEGQGQNEVAQISDQFDRASINFSEGTQEQAAEIVVTLEDSTGRRYSVTKNILVLLATEGNDADKIDGPDEIVLKFINEVEYNFLNHQQRFVSTTWEAFYVGTNQIAGDIDYQIGDKAVITFYDLNTAQQQVEIVVNVVDDIGDRFTFRRTVNVRAGEDIPDVYISGPDVVDVSSITDYEYFLENYLENNITNASWEFFDLEGEHLSLGQIAGSNASGNVRFNNKGFFEREVEIVVTLENAVSGFKYTVHKKVLLHGGNPFYIDYVDTVYFGTTTILKFVSVEELNQVYTVDWNYVGESSVLSFLNSGVKVKWDKFGLHTLNGTVTYNGKVYTILARINVIEPKVLQPSIVGKQVITTTAENYKYDIKTDVINAKASWSVTGGTIIDSSNTSVIIDWASHGGTVYATVDLSEGLSEDVAPFKLSLNVKGVVKSNPYTTATSTNENYIKSTVYKQPTTEVSNPEKLETITYVDALGRPKQEIALNAGANKEHIVTHLEYDPLGRQEKTFLSYATNNISTAFRTNALSEVKTFYNTDKYEKTKNPYTETLTDGSPLERVLKQSAPGEDWGMVNLEDHTVRTKYDIVKNTDNIINYHGLIDSQGKPSLYEAEDFSSAIYKRTLKNENWKKSNGKDNTTEEYTDYLGRTVLKRTYNENVPHDTYYVYDEHENLVFVLPPKVTNPVSEQEIQNLCYTYIYDEYNRMSEKIIPGKGAEYMVYDKLDRPVLVQDAHMRLNNQWLFTKYDILGRAVYTGIYTHNEALTRDEMQEFFERSNNTTVSSYEEKQTSAGALATYYSNNNFPKTNVEIYTVNYYDDYIFDIRDADAELDNLYEVKTTNTKGLATGTKVKVLETDDWIITVSYYDEKARPVLVYNTNEYLQTTDVVASLLDFTGKVTQTRKVHKKSGKQTIVTIDSFVYDHLDRLISQTQCIGDESLVGCNEAATSTNLVLNTSFDLLEDKVLIDESSITFKDGFSVTATNNKSAIFKIAENAGEQIVLNTYDELGQLTTKKVGGKVTDDGLQKIDYTYNIRGWLTNINNDSDINDNDLFNFALKYNDPTLEENKRLFNGNIAETRWQTANVNSSVKTYNYSYDALNRLTAATGVETPNYDVSGISYDKNGNILTLQRNGHRNITATSFGVMDNLTYKYDTGNKLKEVTDHENNHFGFKDDGNVIDDYGYDANGNMKYDRNKRITNIHYNHLNLPTRVSINGKDIYYTYDAAGMKLSKTVEGVTTQYAGGYIYENDVLQFFNHPEGYVKPDNTGKFDYVYQYKDHLGNVRLSYTDNNKDGVIDAATEIIEESNYYPFGLKHKGYNNNYNPMGNSTAQKFGFGGKEHQDELGLGWIDVTARNYDAALGRWMNLDPLAEKMRRHSPYNFGFNNPIYFQDYDGMMPQGPPSFWNRLKQVVVSEYQAVKHSLEKIKLGGISFSDGGEGRGGLVKARSGNPSSSIDTKGVIELITTLISQKTRFKSKGDGKTNASLKSDPKTTARSSIEKGISETKKTAKKVEAVTKGVDLLASDGTISSSNTTDEKVNTVSVQRPGESSIRTSRIPVSEAQSKKDSIREVKKGNKVKIHRPKDEDQ